MGATLRTSILACSACLLTPLGAAAASHPTHAPSREPRRLIVPVSPHESSHARAGRRGTSHAGGRTAQETAAAPHHGGPSVHGRHEASGAGRGPHTHKSAGGRHGGALVAGDRQTYDRVHAWEHAQHAAAPEAASEAAVHAGVKALPETGTTPPTATPGAQVLAPTELSTTSPELPKVPTIEQEAATPVFLASLYDKRGRLVVPTPLYGSHELLVRQNQMADRDGSTRVRDEEDLIELRRQRKLVALPHGAGLRVDDRLPADRRFSRPWTATFLATLSRDFYASFHEPLQVNSAVRTVDVQEHLLRVNGNAAPAAGETASPHLTGQAVDIAKRGLTMVQIAWMRAYLEPLITAGKIDVEEEFQQSCFHISVYKSYEPTSQHVTVATAAQAHAGPVE